MNNDIQVSMRLTKDISPIIRLSAKLNESENGEKDLLYLFMKMIVDKEKYYKTELEPAIVEYLAVPVENLPEKYKNANIDDIPSIYKKQEMNLYISLKEITKEISKTDPDPAI